MQFYHDFVYGVLKTETNVLFKFLVLEMMQAGLSWQAIINREADYDLFFGDYDVYVISELDFDITFDAILKSNLIKNRLKVKAIISNAKLVVGIESRVKFYDFLVSLIDIDLSLEDNVVKIVKVLKGYGFKFVGFEIVKSFFESIGLINNHDMSCVYYQQPLFELKD